MIAHLFRVLLSLAIVSAACVHAQQTSVPRESVIVTGTYEPVPLEEIDRSVSSFPVRAQALLFDSLIDFLRLDSSLDVRQRAPNDVQSDPSIRGGTFGQT